MIYQGDSFGASNKSVFIENDSICPSLNRCWRGVRWFVQLMVSLCNSWKWHHLSGIVSDWPIQGNSTLSHDWLDETLTSIHQISCSLWEGLIYSQTRSSFWSYRVSHFFFLLCRMVFPCRLLWDSDSFLLSGSVLTSFSLLVSSSSSEVLNTSLFIDFVGHVQLFR